MGTWSCTVATPGRGEHLLCGVAVPRSATLRGAGTHCKCHVARALEHCLPGWTQTTPTLDVVRAIQITAESRRPGKGHFILGWRSALTVGPTLKDEYVFC